MPDVSARRERRGAVQIRPTPSESVGTPYGTQNPQRFTTPWVAIARAQALAVLLKSGRDPRNPQFGEGGGPVEAAALGARADHASLALNRERQEPKCVAHRERVHKVDLPTHDTLHGLIPTLVLRNHFGG
jgi:hypothetical protein